MKNLIGVSIAAAMMLAAVSPPGHAAQLATDARGGDSARCSATGGDRLSRDAEFYGSDGQSAQPRVEPPEMKQFDEALSKFTLKPVLASGKPESGSAGEPIDQYVDELAFALFRPTPEERNALQSSGDCARAVSGSGYSGEL